MSALFSVRLVVLDFFGDCYTKVDVETVQNTKIFNRKRMLIVFSWTSIRWKITHCYIAIIL